MARRLKILVVDDSELTLSIVRAVLTAAGHEVKTHYGGIGTAAAIHREQPDLVLLDVEMPLIRGDEISKNLHHGAGSDRRVVLLHSSRPAEELAAMAQRAGIDGYVEKKADPRHLVDEIESWERRLGRRGESNASGGRGGPILVAGDQAFLDRWRIILGSSATALFTDSGTEALRRILSRDPPAVVVCDATLLDLRCEAIFHNAVQHDPRWRTSLVFVGSGTDRDESLSFLRGESTPFLEAQASTGLLRRSIHEIRGAV